MTKILLDACGLCLFVLSVVGCADGSAGAPPANGPGVHRFTLADRDLSGAVVFEESPSVAKPGWFVVHFSRESAPEKLVDPGGEVDVAIAMACCGSPPPDFQIERTGVGTYVVSDVRWWTGDWKLTPRLDGVALTELIVHVE